MMQTLDSVKYGLLVAVLIFVAGCGGGKKDRPSVVPVSGTVMYKGKAVEGATVTFMAEGAPRAATGVTDAQGKFQLSTFAANDGAMIGEHKITVSKVTGGNATPPPAAGASDPDAMLKQYRQTMTKKADKPKSDIPEKYSNAATSNLKETVTEDGPNTFVLQLTD